MENTPDKENYTYENYTYGKVFLRRIHWAKNSNTNTFWLSFEFKVCFGDKFRDNLKEITSVLGNCKFRRT